MVVLDELVSGSAFVDVVILVRLVYGSDGWLRLWLAHWGVLMQS